MRTLIRGAAVVDGTETERYRADVLVDGTPHRRDRQAGSAGRPRHRRRRAGADPRFIDMHAHSDLAVLLDPAHLAKLSQGVTTELLAQDGLS
jgi:N-acyl-D-amino-acid deacylase